MTADIRPHSAGLAPALEARIGAVVGQLSKWLATAGALLLLGLAVMTIVSVLGRAAYTNFGVLRPIRGDFELVGMGTAIAIFAFLPYCQYRRGHVAVEVATDWAGPRTKAFLGMIANVVMTAAAAFIAWRLHAGLLNKMDNGETTFIIGVPTWWAYAACAVGAWATVVVTAYTVWRSLNEWLGEGEPRQGNAEAEVS